MKVKFNFKTVEPNHYLHQPYLLWEPSHSLHVRELQQYDKRCPHPLGKLYLTSGFLEFFFHLLVDESTMSWCICNRCSQLYRFSRHVTNLKMPNLFRSLGLPSRHCSSSSIICITQMSFCLGWFTLQGMEWWHQMASALCWHPISSFWPRSIESNEGMLS